MNISLLVEVVKIGINQLYLFAMKCSLHAVTLPKNGHQVAV